MACRSLAAASGSNCRRTTCADYVRLLALADDDASAHIEPWMTRRYLPDAQGRDGVRVTIALEPAVERFARVRERLGLRECYIPLNKKFNDWLARSAQSTLLRGQWAVAVEADTGDRARLLRDDYPGAVDLARQVGVEVERIGVAALTRVGAAD